MTGFPSDNVRYPQQTFCPVGGELHPAVAHEKKEESRRGHQKAQQKGPEQRRDVAAEIEIDRLIEADQLSEAELQAMSHSDLAELRRIMLKALELYLTRALHAE